MSDPKPPPVPPTPPTPPITPIPPISRRSQPRFRSRERRVELAAAFSAQGADYDRLRPGYSEPVIDAILAAAYEGRAPQAEGPETPGNLLAVDLGAGTGKLTLALAARGVDVSAVDPSAAMLDVIDDAATGPALATGPSPAVGPAPAVGPPPAVGPAPAVGPSPAVGPAPDTEAVQAADEAHVPPAPSVGHEAPGRVRTVRAAAEDTGLPSASADLVTAAQAWHWFDVDRAALEARRLLRPGGVLVLLWNTLDVQIPWVHRYSRIMHAGDVQRDDFTPPMSGDFTLIEHSVTRWEDPRTTTELIDLARTRSYVITANEATRAKVLANLDWYLHEHLDHERDAVVGLPYRTDLFLYRPTG